MATIKEIIRLYAGFSGVSRILADDHLDSWTEILSDLKLATKTGTTVTHLSSNLSGVIRAGILIECLASRIGLTGVDPSASLVYFVDGALARDSIYQLLRSRLENSVTTDGPAPGKISIFTYGDFAYIDMDYALPNTTYLLELGAGLHKAEMVILAGRLLQELEASEPQGVNIITLSCSSKSIYSDRLVTKFAGVSMTCRQLPAMPWIQGAYYSADLREARSIVSEIFGEDNTNSNDRIIICSMPEREVRALVDSLPPSAQDCEVYPVGSAHELKLIERVVSSAPDLVLQVDQDVTLWPMMQNVRAVIASAAPDLVSLFDPCTSKVVETYAPKSMDEMLHGSALATGSKAPAPHDHKVAFVTNASSHCHPNGPAFNMDMERLIYNATYLWPDQPLASMPVRWHDDWVMVSEYVKRLITRRCIVSSGPESQHLKVYAGRGVRMARFMPFTATFEAPYLLAMIKPSMPEEVRRVLVSIAVLIDHGTDCFLDIKKEMHALNLAELRGHCRGFDLALSGRGAIWTALGLFEDNAKFAKGVAAQGDPTEIEESIMDGSITLNRPTLALMGRTLAIFSQQLGGGGVTITQSMSRGRISDSHQKSLEILLVRTLFNNLVFIPRREPSGHSRVGREFAYDLTAGVPLQRGVDEAIDFESLDKDSTAPGHFAVYTSLNATQDGGHIPTGLTLVSRDAVEKVGAEFGATHGLMDLIKRRHPAVE